MIILVRCWLLTFQRHIDIGRFWRHVDAIFMGAMLVRVQFGTRGIDFSYYAIVKMV
jgi:hypothetical protein